MSLGKGKAECWDDDEQHKVLRLWANRLKTNRESGCLTNAGSRFSLCNGMFMLELAYAYLCLFTKGSRGGG